MSYLPGRGNLRVLLLGTLVAALAVAGVTVPAGGVTAALGRGSRAGGGKHRHKHHPHHNRKAHPAGDAATPIKHVIVIIGENHTFDNVFATYQAPRNQQVRNLLSEGIVNADGGPGYAVAKARQDTAIDTSAYSVNPTRTGAYSTLPQPNTTYVSKACSGQAGNVPDARFPATLPNAPYQITKFVPYFDSHGQYNSFGTCEFNGAFVGDPLHRFYQMYQEVST
ncbi:MAG: hypothetical protein JO152_12665, partial [Mycobacteriaceae bacterium]|nr:hypothetical protein [Mycobacteriaceae bacterium]